MSRSPNHLLIVSHVVHYLHEGRLFAYGPYAREIDVWAELFPKVTIAAPLRHAAPPGDALALTGRNIVVDPQHEVGGETLAAKIRLMAALPGAAWRLCRAMRRADAIHVRCPGNLGLLGALLAPMFSSYLVAKYAGQWSGYAEEARTVRLQRALLGSSWWRGPVTVYGTWPQQPPHVVPFFTSVLSDDQIRGAQATAALRTPSGCVEILFVGRLSKPKHVDVLISAVEALHRQGLSLRCRVVGDGPEREALRRQVEAAALCDVVRFTGPVGFDRVLDLYRDSDVLVLASESEGWPKAIAEAMAFGLVCVGCDRGLVPQMLADGRGIVVPPGDVHALARALEHIARNPGEYSAMRSRAATWAQQYSLEGLRSALRDLLRSRWNVALGGPLAAPVRLQHLPS
jgi:glycosyltransferase involved in cell wall biosynthesis